MAYGLTTQKIPIFKEIDDRITFIRWRKGCYLKEDILIYNIKQQKDYILMIPEPNQKMRNLHKALWVL